MPRRPSSPRRGSPVAIVTGATGGSGRAICLELARRGWTVAVGFRSKRGAAETIARKCRKLRVPAAAIPLDVRDAKGVASAVRAAAALGPVRCLVNVASYATPGGGYRVPLAKLDIGEIVRAVDVDLGGTLRMIRACAPHIRRAGGGSIVNFGSASADAADPDLLVYMAAKVSIERTTRALARELGPTIRINCVAPGAIATDWVEAWDLPAKERRALERATCVGRLGTAQDVANLVAFLVSDESSYLTGQTIALDGGMFNP